MISREINNVHLTYSDIIHNQRRIEISRMIHYMFKLIMVVLIISTLLLIIQQIYHDDI